MLGCVLGGRSANKDAVVKRFLQERYMPLGIGQPEDVAQAVVFRITADSLSPGRIWMLAGRCED